MPITDEPQQAAQSRLAALGLGPRRGWVPDQSGYVFDQPASPAEERPPPVSPPRPPGPPGPPGSGFRLPPWLDDMVAAPSSRALAGLAVVCVLCLVVTGWTLLHHRAGSVPLPAAGPILSTAAPLPPLPSPSAAGIVVDVGGRVRRPGLVTLPLGARIADAVRAAGGALRRRDLRFVDLAAKVSDGQLLLIGTSAGPGAGASAGSGTPDGAPAGPVDLNTATADQLDTLPGIGPVLAQRIIDWRTAHGSFQSVSDLNDVSGIGDSIFAEISPLVSV